MSQSCNSLLKLGLKFLDLYMPFEICLDDTAKQSLTLLLILLQSNAIHGDSDLVTRLADPLRCSKCQDVCLVCIELELVGFRAVADKLAVLVQLCIYRLYIWSCC